MTSRDNPPPRPALSAGAAPVRRLLSVRRSTTMDVSWPQGRAGAMVIDGRARDLFTDAAGQGQVLAQDRLAATLDPERVIQALEAVPPREGCRQLIGQRGGGGLRAAIRQALPDEAAHHTPLGQLLDDIAGTSLVATWAWSLWLDDWMGKSRPGYDREAFARVMASKVDICSGFVAGGTAASAGADHVGSPGTPTVDLRNPADPEGWHDYAGQDGVGMRRARRIDVWREGGIAVEAAFQDSATAPDGVRRVVHEYSLSARIDPETLRVESLSAVPHVLPYGECVAAPLFLDRLVGVPVAELRAVVLERLRGPAGCTHLNDALRALADLPLLVRPLLA